MRRLVDSRHGQLQVRLDGSGGVPLVLLHMSPLSGAMFDRITPLLARTRLVVRPDRLGFGASDRMSRPLTLPEIAAATADAIRALGLEQVDVCGIHTGSSEALELAVGERGLVRRVVCVALVVLTEDERERFRRTIDPPALAADGSHLRWHWDYWAHVAGLGRSGSHTSLSLTHERAVAHLASWPDSGWTYRAVFDHRPEDLLGRVEQPLLVLCPRDEFWETTQRAGPLLPAGARLQLLPDVDYEAFEFAAAELAGQIDRFLA